MVEFETYQGQAPIECTAEGDVRGEWDPDRLTQVVSNLIGNALQHGAGSPVQVVGRGTPSVVVLTVHNGGPSIPPALQDSIFEPLARYAFSDVGPGRASGWGCSLPVRSWWRTATMIVSSSPTDGTTFTVQLPRYDPVGH